MPTAKLPETISEPEICRKAQQLETVFTGIYQDRMSDIPVINEKIRVTAVGFQQWKTSLLGILVTPWFMNIMLLPGPDDDWEELSELSSKNHAFPSGNYTFTTGHETGIGKYQMCSLFSPMFEFADNDAAVETAEIALRELMNNDNIETGDIDSSQIERIWNGDEQHPDLADETVSDSPRSPQATIQSETTGEADEKPGLTDNLQKPISRRDMLRGTFLRGKAET